MFKTYEKAKIKFDLMVKNGSVESKLIDQKRIDHSKPYSNYYY